MKMYYVTLQNILNIIINKMNTITLTQKDKIKLFLAGAFVVTVLSAVLVLVDLKTLLG